MLSNLFTVQYLLTFFLIEFSLITQEHMIQSEVSILRRVKHPNIVLLIEEMDTNSELYLVMELVKVLHICWFWGRNVKLKCCKSCILGLIL